MANLKFYPENALSGLTLKNGTGGGAPALLEHADFPMSNLVYPVPRPRYKPWRRGGAGTSGSVEVHFDIGIGKAPRGFGLAMHRQYVPGSGGITNIDFYTGPTPTYPPAWTLRGSIAVTPADNDKLLEYTQATARFCRFVITYTGDFSCKLWVVQGSAGVFDIGYEYGAGSTTSIERALTERTTILGVPLLYDVGVGPNTARRRWVLWNLWRSTPFNILRTTIRERPTSFMMQDVDGKFYEVNVVGNDFEWHRLITGISGGLHDSRFEFEQQP